MNFVCKIPYILIISSTISGLSAQNAVNQGARSWNSIDWTPIDVAPTNTTSFFNGENYITIDGRTEAQVGTLRLGDTGETHSSLTLEKNASLAVAKGAYVGNAKDSNFVLNLDSGRFTADALFIGGISADDTYGMAEVALEDAQINISTFIQFSLGEGSSSTRLIIKGAGGRLSANQIQFAVEDQSNPTEFVFKMGRKDIGVIDLKGSLYGAKHVAVTVDGSDYRDKSGTYTLINTDSVDIGEGSIYGDFASLKCVNFGGRDAELSVIGGDLVLTIN